jgi:cell division septal protein FtsQ
MKHLRMQRNAVRRQRRRVVLYLGGALILFGALAGIAAAFSQYVTESPRFLVKKIRVEGANVLREETILAVAGITAEDNLLLSDIEAIRARVASMPYVRECSVQRAFPDTVIIRVEEREAVAGLLVNNRVFELDEESVVLRELEDPSGHAGPLITNVPQLGVVEPGQQLGQPSLHSALALWDAFSLVPVSRELRISEISAPEEALLLVYFDDLPFETRWGRSDYLHQAQNLDILWREKGGKLPCKEYLDLRFDDDLVCK